MNIVFCADKNVVPGLHVSALSVLLSSSGREGVSLFVFSEDLGDDDMALLRKTLEGSGKAYSLTLVKVTADAVAGYPSMRGSWACYFRLLVPSLLKVDRFIYLDIDIVCNVDLAPLHQLDLGGNVAGMVAEWPLSAGSVDGVVEALGGVTDGDYYNSGVMLVDAAKWRERGVTARCMDFLKNHPPRHLHDQPALNFALHGLVLPLDAKYNCAAQKRSNWPLLKAGGGQVLVHYVSVPKPWDWLGSCIHHQYHHWIAVFERTALARSRGGPGIGSKPLPRGAKQWRAYRKTLKDGLIFRAYARGWLKEPKGTRSP